MAKITGNEAKFAIVKATTWGTEVAAGAGDLAQVDSYVPTENVETIESNNLGAGLGMRTNIEQGNKTHEASVTMAAGYQNKADVILASFLGDPQTPVEQTVGEGDYLHVLYSDTALHANGYLTLAEKVTTADAISIPTASVSAITLSHGEPVGDLTLEATFQGSGQDLSPVNNVATLDAATVAPQTKIKVTRQSYWLINERSGIALSTGSHLICPISATLELSRPQIIRNKPCNTAASPAPGSDGFLEGTLTLELEALENLNFFVGAEAETYYKALFHVEGSQIGAGVNRLFEIYLPSLKLQTSPQRALENAGDNPVTLVFTVLAATANPTGMSSTRPYVRLINERSSVY